MAFKEEQMKELRKGIRAKVDVELYKNPELSPEQMKQVRLGLMQGVDVTKYNMPYIVAEQMKELRKALASGVRTDVFTIRNGKNYNVEQTREIRLGLENEQKIELYANPEFSAEQMRQIRIGQRDGIDAQLYATTDFSAEQMKEIRIEFTVQKFIEKIKEAFAELWQKITALFGKTLAVNEIVEEELPPATAIESKIAAIFSEVFSGVEKRIEAIEDNTMDLPSLDERFEAFKTEIETQMQSWGFGKNELTEERKEELLKRFNEETNESTSWEWRQELTASEQTFVSSLDKQFDAGYSKIAKALNDAVNNNIHNEEAVEPEM